MATANKGRRINAMEDRISELPEAIIHHILSSLEKRDATRMSILSKKWRSLWYSFPIWDFDETSPIFDLHEGPESRRERFIKFVDESLRHRLQFFGLQKMRLCLSPMIMSSEIKDIFFSRMDSWISLAIERKVKEIVLQFTYDGLARDAYYSLPHNVFGSESINTLRLEGCNLKPSDDIGLSSLKTLCLQYVFVDDQAIQHLLSSCPLIEFMSLKSCIGLLNLKVLGLLALNTLIVESVAELSKIVIDAPDLKTLTLQHKGELSFGTITTGIINLSLVGLSVSEDTIHGLLSSQPLLETLNLVSCNGFRRINICNQKLKTLMLYSCNSLVEAGLDTQNFSLLEIINVVACVKLKKLKFCGHKLRSLALCGCKNLIDVMLDASEWPELKTLILIRCRNFVELKVDNEELKSMLLYDCKRLVEAYVDAPKLVSFKYIGYGLQFSMMNTSCLLDAELWLYPETIGTIWLHELICLLRWFGHAKVLTLVSNSWQNIIIPKEMRENLRPPLYDLKHLKLKKSIPEEKYEEFLNSLIFSSHLNSLSMSMGFTTARVESMIMVDRPPLEDEHLNLSYTEHVDSSLWSSPHLETLSIDESSADLLLKFQYKSMKDEGGCPFSCWQQCLKEVKIENFGGNEMEISLPEFFLANGEVLEAITVSRPLKEIVDHPRNSSDRIHGMDFKRHLLEEVHNKLLQMPPAENLEDHEVEDLYEIMMELEDSDDEISSSDDEENLFMGLPEAVEENLPQDQNPGIINDPNKRRKTQD